MRLPKLLKSSVDSMSTPIHLATYYLTPPEAPKSTIMLDIIIQNSSEILIGIISSFLAHVLFISKSMKSWSVKIAQEFKNAFDFLRTVFGNQDNQNK